MEITELKKLDIELDTEEREILCKTYELLLKIKKLAQECDNDEIVLGMHSYDFIDLRGTMNLLDDLQAFHILIETKSESI